MHTPAEALASDGREHAAALGSSMYRNELPDQISISDLHFRTFALVFQILRCGTHRRIRIERIVFTDRQRTIRNNCAIKRVRSRLHIRTDDAIGTDVGRFRDARGRCTIAVGCTGMAI